MHITLIKDPSQHTQRTKDTIELQTGERNWENIGFTLAEYDLFGDDGPKEKPAKTKNRCHTIKYCHKSKTMVKEDYKTKKFSEYV